jgi:hypothetical protein
MERRGELISIMANLARKADRIESAMSGANASQDETIIDTAVDLFVYTIKYMTFLADQDPLVAALFPGQSSTSGFSDGVSGFDHVLAAASVSDGPGSASVDTQQAAREQVRLILSHVGQRPDRGGSRHGCKL